MLDQPLIVAEGYDVSHAAPALQSNYNVSDFLSDIRNTGGFNLQSALDEGTSASPSSSYDIVFIDYNNGTDDIRRNAALFEEVVRWVNANKLAKNGIIKQNVVLGISMGGLIARYGLAEMSKNPQLPNNNPDTRLLITHDSPHHGANTPLGVQAITRQANATLLAVSIRSVASPTWHFITGNDILPELAQAESLLEEPASKQLLRVRMTRNGLSWLASYGIEYNSFIEGDYRAMITPTAGQSFPYQFIATSLGSQCGRELYAPYTELIRVEANGFFSVLPGMPAAVGMHTQVIVNAMPVAGQVERIAGLRVWVDTEVIGISLPRVYLSRSDIHSPANNPIALDGLAGGTQPISGRAGLSSSSGRADLFGLGVLYGDYNIALQREFCFVPTASALDVVTFDNTAAHASYANNVAPPANRSQAASFIAQAQFPYYSTTGPVQQRYNSSHPEFPGRQAEWIYSKIENLPLPSDFCTSECNPAANNAITGPLTLCVGGGGSATYTSPIQGAGYTYSWVASPTSFFTVASGSGPTFQTANAPGVNNEGTITLTVNTGCQFTFSKRVAIGLPDRPLVSGPDEVYECNAGGPTFFITNYDPGLSYTFTASPQIQLRPFQSGTIYSLTRRTGAGYITVTATNGCGSSLSTQFDFTVLPCTGYTVYPNPADNALTVEQTDSTGTPRSTAARGTTAASSSAAPGPPYTVRLFDSYGVQQAPQATTTPTLSLPTGPLPTGLYLLHIEVNGAVIERRRVQITH